MSSSQLLTYIPLSQSSFAALHRVPSPQSTCFAASETLRPFHFAGVLASFVTMLRDQSSPEEECGRWVRNDSEKDGRGRKAEGREKNTVQRSRLLGTTDKRSFPSTNVPAKAPPNKIPVHALHPGNPQTPLLTKSLATNGLACSSFLRYQALSPPVASICTPISARPTRKEKKKGEKDARSLYRCRGRRNGLCEPSRTSSPPNEGSRAVP